MLILDYSVEIREPVNITYRGFTLHSCPAPSSGIPSTEYVDDRNNRIVRFEYTLGV